MDESKQQLIDRLKTANNILVTVGRNPSVDQLAALLGLTLFLNKQGKHAAAVFSGQVPSTIEFLQPEETIEKNTDSLRDFIIALDKSKADKLRYKVEDNVVRIFITPYKTSISQDDFEFSQGDFNVDVVIALGVQRQEDLDEAIVAHGRILHDATVASITTTMDGGIGTINWQQPEASSLSELVTELVEALGQDKLDQQISTALLTGIVAETDRFSNDKTSSLTMSASAVLMEAGANQQLIASKLQEGKSAPADLPQEKSAEEPKPDDGTLEISHSSEDTGEIRGSDLVLPAPDEEAAAHTDSPVDPEISSEPDLPEALDKPQQPVDQGPQLAGGSKLITEPPTLGGVLTANSAQEGLDPATDPLSNNVPGSLPNSEPPQLLDHRPDHLSQPTVTSMPELPSEVTPKPPTQDSPDIPSAPLVSTPDSTPEPVLPNGSFTPPPPAWVPPATPATPAPAAPSPLPEPQATPQIDQPTPAPQDDKPSDDDKEGTLADLEESVASPHLDTSSLDAARDEVTKALTQATASGTIPPEPLQAIGAQPMVTGLNTPEPSTDSTPAPAPPAGVNDPTAPPPVPPPIPFQFGNQPPTQ